MVCGIFFKNFWVVSFSLGLRDNVRCSSWAQWKARSGLPINVSLIELFSLGVTAEALTGENRSKIGDFTPTQSNFTQHFR